MGSQVDALFYQTMCHRELKTMLIMLISMLLAGEEELVVGMDNRIHDLTLHHILLPSFACPTLPAL